MSEKPPPFTDAEAPPPQYTLPETFNIGRHSVGLLLQPKQLKGHLALLHAFHTLRNTLDTVDASRFPDDVRELEPEKRWGWFVTLAVERFERWCLGSTEEPIDNIESWLPPVDVLMVWHAYLLNPIWYAEDTFRLPSLKRLPIFTDYLANTIESPSLLITGTPPPSRVQTWERTTNTPYDPLDAMSVLTHKDVQCPYCRKRKSVPFVTSTGSGYAQRNFMADCSICGKNKIKKDVLGLHKFAVDVATTALPEGFLAGTLHTPFMQQDVDRASLTKKRVIAALSPGLAHKRDMSFLDVMSQVDSKLALLTTKLNARIQRGVVERILSAYTDDRPFSIDLVGAVLRQASFVRKMVDLGWTDPGFFSDEEDMVVLQHCVARYHAFLSLMADSPGSFFVPTLDIDLAWHTHQLRAKHYSSECMSYVGRYIDHDDKVEEDHLATAFDVTCRAWKDRYGLPYTYCGCPLPGTTLAQRLRRALHLHHHPHNVTSNDPLRPPPEAEAGTHASDHNAIFPLHDRKASELARERRRQKAARRRERESRGHHRLVTTGERRDTTHEIAFFYPVPLWYGPVCGAPGVTYETGAGVACGGGGASCGAGTAAGGGSACTGGGATCGVGGSTCGGGGSTCGGGGSSCGGGGGCGGGGCGGGCGGG